MEPKNEVVPPEIAGQFKEIAETHGTNISMIRNLWLGGVKAEDLSLVVDIRDGLSIQSHENNKSGN